MSWVVSCPPVPLCARAVVQWQLREDWCPAVRTLSLGWQGAIRAKITPQPLVAVVLTHPLSPLGGQSHVEDPGS